MLKVRLLPSQLRVHLVGKHSEESQVDGGFKSPSKAQNLVTVDSG